jgi:hypothetical protein
MSGKFEPNITVPISPEPDTPPLANVTIFAQNDNRAYLVDSSGNITKFGNVDNPMTAPGDIIVGGSGGAADRATGTNDRGQRGRP